MRLWRSPAPILSPSAVEKDPVLEACAVLVVARCVLCEGRVCVCRTRARYGCCCCGACRAARARSRPQKRRKQILATAGAGSLRSDLATNPDTVASFLIPGRDATTADTARHGDEVVLCGSATPALRRGTWDAVVQAVVSAHECKRCGDSAVCLRAICVQLRLPRYLRPATVSRHAC